jgi:bZIP transcription factor
MPTDLKSNIIFTNPERLAQQYIQSAAPQSQFTALPNDPSNSQAVTDPSLSDPSDTQPDKSDPSRGASSGRVLASSKRAAQNRAAQRAFRQRKERYIKSLEQKATEYDLSSGIIQDLRKENIYLRDYVVRLQNEVDSLNTELGRAPMFATASTQRNAQATTSQQGSLNVPLGQNYSIQIDPQTAAAAAAAAAASSVQSQQENPGLTRLAPADNTHNAISMAAGNDQPSVESKSAEATVSPKKTTRSRKRKADVQSEGQ